MVPQWLRFHLNEEGRGAIGRAVAKAETRTRGEIVPMVVRESAGTSHVPLALTAFLLAMAYAAELQLGKHLLPWGNGAWFLVDAAVAVLLGLWLGRYAWIRRAFTPKADRAQAALLRAEAAFFEHGLDKTKGATGILLFVSLQDHQAVVLADKAIASKLPSETWDEVCEMLLRGARQKDLAAGFQAAIARSASLLEKDFKPKRKNPNELENALRIVD